MLSASLPAVQDADSTRLEHEVGNVAAIEQQYRQETGQ